MSRWQPIAVPDLPDGLVVFDGVCALCSFWVRFVAPRDPAGLYRFAPIQSEAGAELARRFGIDPDYPQTNVVVRDGRAWFKSDAALRVLADLPGWRWTRLLRPVPRVVRDFLYDRIARNRYRLFGRHEACMMPTPELKARFLLTRADLAR